MVRLILASGSKIRSHLLKEAGLRFTVCPARIDERQIEKSWLSEQENPHCGARMDQLATYLACAKSAAISGQNPQACVIGADQILEFAGTSLSKVSDRQAAHQRINQLSGRWHKLHSAYALAVNGRNIACGAATAELHMRRLDGDQITRYLENSGQALLSSVGCYCLEASGIQLFDDIKGDYFAMLGLPLIPLLNALRAHTDIATSDIGLVK